MPGGIGCRGRDIGKSGVGQNHRCLQFVMLCCYTFVCVFMLCYRFFIAVYIHRIKFVNMLVYKKGILKGLELYRKLQRR